MVERFINMHVVRKYTENSIIILCLWDCETKEKYQNYFYLFMFLVFLIRFGSNNGVGLGITAVKISRFTILYTLYYIHLYNDDLCTFFRIVHYYTDCFDVR